MTGAGLTMIASMDACEATVAIRASSARIEAVREEHAVFARGALTVRSLARLPAMPVGEDHGNALGTEGRVVLWAETVSGRRVFRRSVVGR